MNNPVHLVAVGARTALGLLAESSVAAARAGITRTREHALLTDRRGEPFVLSSDTLLPDDLFGVPRLRSLAQSAIDQVREKLSGYERLGPEHIPVLIGTPEPRPGWTRADADRLAAELEPHKTAKPRWSFTVLPLGHAAALEAVRMAAEKVRSGDWPLCVVGGVDSYLDPATLSALEASQRVVVEDARSAFVPGEAAAFLVLAGARMAERAGLPTLAVLRGAHSTFEKNLILTDTVNVGDGLTGAVLGATASLTLPAEQLDAIYGDINGERYRSEEWAFVALRAPHVMRDPAGYIAPASSFGDVGAASGALALIMALHSAARGYARGPRTLVWGGSEAGLRAAVVIERL